MLIRTLIVTALVALPLSMNAATLDLSQLVHGAAKIAKVAEATDSAFQAGWWNSWKSYKWKKKNRYDYKKKKRHYHKRKKGHGGGDPKPENPIPEPTSAVLFGLGAVAVGAGISRRRRK